MKTLCSSVPTQFVNYLHLERYTGDLLINCTPVGMYPKTDVSPVGLETVEHFETAVDLIYNPAKTLFCSRQSSWVKGCERDAYAGSSGCSSRGDLAAKRNFKRCHFKSCR